MNPRPPASQMPGAPELSLSPLAWLKLQFLLHAGNTEIGGFGVSHEQNPLYVEDLAIVGQKTTAVSVEFDDSAVADLFDRMTDQGIPPQRFARIWIHTHPGDSAQPSGLDEQTFARVFGSCDWAVMLILARSGNTYARLRVSGGPGAQLRIPVSVDWASWPGLAYPMAEGLGDLIRRWAEDYVRHVHPVAWGPEHAQKSVAVSSVSGISGVSGVALDDAFLEPEWREYLEELAIHEEAERQMALAGQEVAR